MSKIGTRRIAACSSLRGAGALLALVVGAAHASSDQWVGVRSPHFIVASDAGEKRARQTAHQFEQIRGLFHTLFQARVDPMQPVIVLAVRDERGLKELLPRYWEREGGVRPAGVFASRDDKDYVALRLDAGGPNPFHVVYHEYVHLLLSLNFRRLPLWLDEGLAEFYASAVIDDDEVRWGQPFSGSPDVSVG
jgi:hypothetical protein